MLIHWQNSYVPYGKHLIGCREAQSCELVNKVKNSLYILNILEEQP
jgi:hypothetical protein